MPKTLMMVGKYGCQAVGSKVLNIKNYIGGLKQFRGDRTLSQLEVAVGEIVQNMGEERFADQAAHSLADLIEQTGIIPDAYRSYRQIVHDGILLFLSKLPVGRLAAIVSHQIFIDEQTSAEERLVELAKKIPTLHKLGQMIARNRYLDPRIRVWLVQLENGSYGTDAIVLCRGIEARLGPDKERFRIRTERRVLSEASVGGVVPFTWLSPGSKKENRGVFKVLKPTIGACLTQEIAALDCLADYFQENRRHYSFGRFRFRELFEDVKTALLEELDLSGEQANLDLACRFYKKDKTIQIPEVSPFSTRYFTAMSFVDGAKVTDALTSKADRCEAAVSIFKAIICAPLFSDQDRPIFHGDPHAGNIFSSGRDDAGKLRVSLLDWSQTGCLAKQWRISMLKFIQGVLLGDEKMICRAVSSLSEGDMDDALPDRIRTAVDDVCRMVEYRSAPLVKKAFIMLDRLSIQGIRFPKDLLLFRKTFFTLNGLLTDLDPDFDMDRAIMAYMRELLLGELPKRLASLIVPFIDSPERYRSLLSNKDLQMLLINYAIECIRKNADRVKGFIEKNERLLGTLSGLPMFFVSRTAKVLFGLYYLYKLEFSET